MITPELILSLLNALTILAEGVIGLRITLKLFGALETAPFVQWVYQTSKPLLYPFEGMFPSSTLPGAPFTIEFSAIFALFFYAFIGYILQEMIQSIHLYFGRIKSNKKKYTNGDDGS
jgi:uncharacterized protein YggT (Ycf19 family)